MQEILEYGYHLIESVFPTASSGGAVVMRGAAAPFSEFIRNTYRLTRETAPLRAAYYRTRPRTRFSNDPELVIVVWDDAIVQHLGGSGAAMGGCLPGEDEPRLIPAGRAVALPRKLRLTNVSLRRATGGEWISTETKVERTFSKVGPNRLHLPDDLLAKIE